MKTILEIGSRVFREEPPRIYGFIVSCFRIVNSVNTQARARARFSSLFTSPRLRSARLGLACVAGIMQIATVNSTERGKDYKITFQLSCFVCNDHDFPGDSRAARSPIVSRLNSWLGFHARTRIVGLLLRKRKKRGWKRRVNTWATKLLGSRNNPSPRYLFTFDFFKISLHE